MTPRPTADGIPDGFYAVPSPSDPAILTLWRVQDGRLKDWPDVARWRPMPPPYPDTDTLPKADRRAWRQEWYDRQYFPWKSAVIEAIRRDPVWAASRFAAEHGQVALPPPPTYSGRRIRRRPPQPRNPSPAVRRRAIETLMASALRSAGMTHRQVADCMGVPTMTAYRRASSAVDRPAAAASLLDRAEEIEARLLVGRLLHPEDAPLIDRWLAELHEVTRRLREQR